MRPTEALRRRYRRTGVARRVLVVLLMTEFSAQRRNVPTPTIIDYCDPDGVAPLVVIQYVRGISLAAIVRRCGALSLLRSSNIACQILAALETAPAGAITSDDILVEPHRDGSELVRISFRRA